MTAKLALSNVQPSGMGAISLPVTSTIGECTIALKAAGAAVLKCDPKRDLAEIARNLGRPVPSRRSGPLVDQLKTMTTAEAPARSLSSVHGTGSFPWHTDGAHWRLPPRYFLLRLLAPESSARTTILADFASVDLEHQERVDLMRLVWLTNGGRGHYLTPLVNDSLVPGEVVARFDAQALIPAHPTSVRAKEILEQALGRQDPIEVHWAVGHVLIVDNWRCFHARSGEPMATEDRVLERVWVV